MDISAQTGKMRALLKKSERRKGVPKLAHVAYTGVICSSCGLQANVTYNKEWWQCPKCHFFNKVIMRLPLWELPSAGPDIHQAAIEFLEENE